MTSDEQRDPGNPSTPPSAYQGPYSYGSGAGYPPPTGSAYGQPYGQTYGSASYGSQSYGGQPYGTPPAPVQPPAGQPGGGQPGSTALLERPRRRRGGILVAATLAAVIGAGAGIGSYAYLGGETSSATSPISVTTVPAASSPVLDGTISAAAAKIDPSVVTITVRAGNSGDIGSGVVLDTDGHILTNNHVVSAAQSSSGQGSGQTSLTVTFPDGRTAPATIVGTSTTNDLAVIKVDGVSDLKPATFAKSDALQVGQAVVAAGAPLGLSESITSGIVSNTARPVRSGNDNDAVYLAVQTDAAINPGNSGGPLVDLNGSIVGINSSIASTGASSSSTSQSGNIGIGFAIPSDVAVRVAGELIADGKSVNAALGVTVGGSADSDLSTATGVALQTVTSDGAAAAAGLKAGDVVTQVDDFHTTAADGLIAATRYFAPGTTVKITYVRDGGAAQTVDVKLGSA
ncbi:MAG: trypsin-like peptidase domain-containing protein [Janthinobacterium lividum]